MFQKTLSRARPASGSALGLSFTAKLPPTKCYLGPPRIGLAAEGDQARSQAEDEGRLMRQASEFFDAVDKESAVKSAFIHCSRTEGGARSSKPG